MEEESQVTNNSLLPTSSLSIEVWGLVFEKLKEDLESLMTCRLVCVEFKEEVDRNMVIWCKAPELNPLTMEEIPVTKLWTEIHSRHKMMFFQKQMENHGGNPFPTRMLSFHPERCDCCDKFCGRCLPDFKNVYFRFFQFSKRFGSHVHNLKFTVVNQCTFEQLKKSVFHNFPNLHQLELKMVKSSNGSWRNNGINWLKNFNFPPLIHLSKLKLHFDKVATELLIPQLFNAYGSQIKTLSLSMYSRFDTSESISSLKEVTSDLFQNLTNLKIRFQPEPEVVLNFLKNGNWPLKQLTMFEWLPFGNTLKIIKLNDFMEVISKFASTLNILHLDFPVDGNTMDQLQSMDGELTPEQEKNELQLHIKLPLVEELSLPYMCLHIASFGTMKLCEKFKNLKTLWFSADEFRDEDLSNFEELFNEIWWPFLSPASKLERVIIYCGNQFDENVTIHTVINKPNY